MKALRNDEFANMILSMPASKEEFRATATYDPDGDCIEFLIKPDNFYAHRIDELVTVYYSEETNELVGSFIKSVGAFCRKLIQQSPWFAIVVEEPPVRLSHLFVARLMQLEGRPDQEELRLAATAYKELIKYAKQEDVDIPHGACSA